jgi:hypothetical protein
MGARQGSMCSTGHLSHRLPRAAVTVQATPGEGPPMGPANSLADKFAATAGLRHRQLLDASMPRMHATPMLNAHLVLLW